MYLLPVFYVSTCIRYVHMYMNKYVILLWHMYIYIITWNCSYFVSVDLRKNSCSADNSLKGSRANKQINKQLVEWLKWIMTKMKNIYIYFTTYSLLYILSSLDSVIVDIYVKFWLQFLILFFNTGAHLNKTARRGRCNCVSFGVTVKKYGYTVLK